MLLNLILKYQFLFEFILICRWRPRGFSWVRSAKERICVFTMAGTMHVVRIPAPRLQRQQQALPFFKLVKALVVLRA
jgi:hypothetical protein